jgi:hypothetical protein
MTTLIWSADSSSFKLNLLAVAARRTLIDDDSCGGCIGAKTPLFAPFIYKNDHFAKTGSGQT